MPTKKKERPFYQRVAIDIAGFGLMIIAPFLGWLPGPGGIPLFLAGLGLVSLNHEWAENLLKDFEKKREYYTDKFLMADPRVSRAIDALCTVLIAGSSYIAVTTNSFLMRAAALGVLSISTIIILSNQKRFERLSAWFKKSRNKS